MQLLFAFALVLVAVAAQTTYDCPRGGCIFPSECSSNININNAGIDVTKSPFYDQVITEGYDHDDTDNACVTYFPCYNGSYFFCRYITFNNGSSRLDIYIYVPVEGVSGVYRAQGIRGTTGCDGCVFTDYILGEACSGGYVLYRCYSYGDCVNQYGAHDIRFGFSSTENVTQECKDQMFYLSSAANPGLRPADPIDLPNKLEKKCLVTWNGMKCVNYERVPCEYRVHL